MGGRDAETDWVAGGRDAGTDCVVGGRDARMGWIVGWRDAGMHCVVGGRVFVTEWDCIVEHAVEREDVEAVEGSHISRCHL